MNIVITYSKESAPCIQNQALFKHSAMLYNNSRLSEFYELETKGLQSSKKNCYTAE